MKTYNRYRCTPTNSAKWDDIKLECAPSLIRRVWLAKSARDLIAPVAKHHDSLNAPRLLAKTMAALTKLRAIDNSGSHFSIAAKMDVIDQLADFHGVEYIGEEYGSGKQLYALNAGDPYATTLLFRDTTLSITTIGDLVESDSRKIKWHNDR